MTMIYVVSNDDMELALYLLNHEGRIVLFYIHVNCLLYAIFS